MNDAQRLKALEEKVERLEALIPSEKLAEYEELESRGPREPERQRLLRSQLEQEQSSYSYFHGKEAAS